MKSRSFTLSQLPATAFACVENATDDLRKEHTYPNNAKLETITVRVAGGFVLVVFLMTLVSLALVVAGYAGSAFAP